jgi:WD repeat-containing protein 48
MISEVSNVPTVSDFFFTLLLSFDFLSELQIANERITVNLGHWVLRSLFANLVKEELYRDSEYRKNLGQYQQSTRHNVPPSLQLPDIPLYEGFNDKAEDSSQATPRNIIFSPAATPGLSIGLATPHPGQTNPSVHAQSHLSSPQNERQSLEKSRYQSQSRASSDKSSDYFSSNPNRQTSTENHTKTPTSPGNGFVDVSSQPGLDQDKEEKSKEGTTLFKKKFRMNFPKKLGRFSADPKPAVADEKLEESEKSESKDDKGVEDNIFGTIQNIRKEYEEKLLRDPLQPILTILEPDLQYIELLKPPPYTTIIIQEDQPDSGGVADLYQGTVESLGQDADIIEKTAPMWLGELLLRVRYNYWCRSNGEIFIRHRAKHLRRKSQKLLLFYCLMKIVCRTCPFKMGE